MGMLHKTLPPKPRLLATGWTTASTDRTVLLMHATHSQGCAATGRDLIPAANTGRGPIRKMRDLQGAEDKKRRANKPPRRHPRCTASVPGSEAV